MAAATLKLPAFWPADPELWFAQVEAQFNTRSITTDDTKFAYLIAALTPESAAEVRDLLITPPASQKYKTLKETLIKRTTNSEQARLKQLLLTEELDGRRPTQFLRRMRQLVGSNTTLVSDDLLKQLFVPRLPSHVQAILAANDSLTLDKLAEMADKVIDVIGPQINAVASPVDDVSDLKKEINELKQLIRGRQQDRSGNRRSRSRTPASRVTNQDSLCWYHRTYGDKAQKCKSPCSFKPKNDNSSH